MNVYEYTVCTLTSRGKEVPHFRKVIKTEMGIYKVIDFLSKKYTGFHLKVDNVVDWDKK